MDRAERCWHAPHESGNVRGHDGCHTCCGEKSFQKHRSMAETVTGHCHCLLAQVTTVSARVSPLWAFSYPSPHHSDMVADIAPDVPSGNACGRDGLGWLMMVEKGQSFRSIFIVGCNRINWEFKGIASFIGVSKLSNSTGQHSPCARLFFWEETGQKRLNTNPAEGPSRTSQLPATAQLQDNQNTKQGGGQHKSP